MMQSETLKEYSYLDIYNILKFDYIENNLSSSNRKLPSEHILSTQFSVKRFVVRKAIKQLIAEGLVFAIRNKGYYVKLNDIDVRIHKHSNYTQNMCAKKLTPRVKLLELTTVTPTNEQQELFGLSEHEKLWEVRVLRYYKNIPHMIGKSYIPFNRVPDFRQYYLKMMSIYKVFEEGYGIKPTRHSSICKAEISDKKESKLLSIFENTPLLKVTSINVDQDNIPIEQCISKFRADIVQLKINL